MDRIEQVVLAVALAAASLAAQATPGINGCVTPDRRPLYVDDAARNQCKDSVIKRLNPDASSKDSIPAPLTPGERKAKEERDRRLAACNIRNREQRQKDEALIDRYQSEDDLQDARYAALGEQLRRINGANDRMKDIIAKGKQLTEEGRFFAPPHRMPANLQGDREANYRLERSQIGVIEDAARAIKSINDRFDLELKRYLALINGTAAMPCGATQ